MPMIENNKKLVEEVAGWLRMYDDGSVDRTWMGPSEVEFLVTPYHPSSEVVLERDGIVLQDRLITMNDLDVSLRFYMPVTVDKKTTEKLPIILHFQGGGFCISKATWFMYYQFYSRIATSCQAVVISVSTRLAPEHRLPSAIDDGYTALLWLRSLARSDEIDVVGDKLDFSRVFLMGDSSGGNLVHEVAARVGRDEENDYRFWSPLKLAGAIPVHPGFVRSYRSISEMEGKEGPFLTLDMLDKLLALALPVGSTKDHPFTCPMGDAAPRLESLRLPPMMVCVAENDLMRDTQIEYVEAMKVAGKDVRLFVNQSVDHCFYFNKMAVDHDLCVGKATNELINVVKVFIGAH